MIRNAGKAYSVFDAARLVLASGDRFHVRFKMAPDAGAKLYAVPTDGSLWLSKEEALTHVIHGDAISTFYKVDEVELEVPKGNFTSVAVCGMSGALLGPPSHHSYQTTLHKIHREQFGHLPFEDYKRRVRTDSSPEAVEKWKESQKHGMQWTWLKGEVAEGEEPKTFKSRNDMEAHFRANHAEKLVGEVSDATVSGNIPKKLLAPSLYNHLRRAVDESRKHLLGTAQQLCSGFERHGLKLFKRRGGKLWVSRTRPRLLEGNVVLSVRIAKMVEIIKTQPGIQVKKLVETVAPSAPATSAPAATAAVVAAPAPVVVATTPVEPAPLSEPAVVAEAFGASTEVVLPPIEPADAAPAESIEAEAPPAEAEATADSVGTDAPGEEAVEEAPALESAPAPAPVSKPAPAAVSLPTAPAAAAPAAHHEWSGDQLHALQDLHWLNSEGYVIEYADGVVFPGVTEPPPPKPKAPAKEKAAGVAPAGEAQGEAEADAPAAEEEASAPAADADSDADVTSESFSDPAPEVTDSIPEPTAPETEPVVETETETEPAIIEVASDTEAPVEVEAEVEAPSTSEDAPEAAANEASETEAEPASTEEKK
jgi:hypothetical protein